MSQAPGVITKDITSKGSPTPSTDVSTDFVVGLAARGPVGVAVERGSIDEFTPVFGGEVPYGYLYDDCFWTNEEEGADGWYSRVVGPAPKAASNKLVNAGAENVAEITAANVKADTDPGEWGNSVKAQITVPEAGKITLIVKLGATVVEEFTGTRAEVIGQAKSSGYVRYKELLAADPKAQEVTLTGGTDDRANITITQWEAAQAAFRAELGPGQLKWPGQTTKAARIAMMEHAKTFNRTVVPDAVDTRTKATHLSAKVELSAVADDLLEVSFLPFAPWIPVSIAGGLTKVLPPSIFVGAVIARHDAETYDPVRGITNPNSPAAGKDGVIDSAQGLSQEPWSDAERAELKLAINVIRLVYGEVRIYGYRTMVDPDDDPNHIWGSNRRLDMAIKARGQVDGEEAVFGQIGNKGGPQVDLAAALKVICQGYADKEALFADPRPGVAHPEAYSVDVSEAVNPIEQLFEGKVRAVVRARRSPLAEVVEIDYVVEGVS